VNHPVLKLQHDIAKLQDQVQQVSLAQKGTEAKMDDLKTELNNSWMIQMTKPSFYI